MKRSMLHAAVAAALIGFSMTASADFSGYYAPAQWATVHASEGGIDLGSVDTTGAAASITLIGSNSSPEELGLPSRLEFTITAPAAGTFSFDWSYASSDESPLYDPAGWIVNGPLRLTDDEGGSSQSGHLSVSVLAGDVIGFHVTTEDNYGGNATLTITNFSAPLPVPEPASVAMMSLGLLGLAGLAGVRRRRAS